MTPEITITIKITVDEKGVFETAIQAEEDVEALESLAVFDLPPVPEVEPAPARAASESLDIPDLPPVPEAP
jgi:hypothetical protein